MHGSEFKNFYHNHSFLGKWIVSKTLSSASKVLVLSDSWKDFYSTLVDQRKILVIPNFVKMPEQSSDSGSVEFTHGLKHQMLFLGYVGVRKGIYDLIDAVALNSTRLDNLKILVGGNGEIEKAKEYATIKGVADKFYFLGWVGSEQKAELLKSANSFILPSRNEGLPVSILEAMSYGLPVIGTNVGAVASLYSEANGYWLVEAQDINSLSNRIVSLVSDENVGRSVGQYNRTLIRNFYSEDAVTPILKEAYREFV
jgi:glycosyltransferase involved in cell wall biosynthesis